MSINYRWAGLSQQGKEREHNEDSFIAVEGFGAVSDGIGGSLAGEVASALAVQRLEEVFREASILEDARERALCMVRGFEVANRAVYYVGQDDRDKRGLGATLAAA